MTQYFYIPIEHEAVLTAAVNEWTSQPNNGWTCITGVYETSVNFIQGNSTVQNTTVIRTVITIPYSYLIESQNYSLKGFCLEGNLDYYTPNFKTALLLLNGVQAFNTAQEYLQYINN